MIRRIVSLICSFLFLYRKILIIDKTGMMNIKTVRGRICLKFPAPPELIIPPKRRKISFIPSENFIITPIGNKTESSIVSSKKSD
jgi:hypothetical protein